MDSYASLEYADDYLGGLTGVNAWVQATAEDKAKALRTATLRIDALACVGSGFRGQKADQAQPLEFPRAGQEAVPDAVQRACCHEALYLIDTADDAAAARRERAIRQGVTSASVGDVSESYAKLSELTGGMRGRLGSDMAAALVRPYLAIRGVYPIR